MRVLNENVIGVVKRFRIIAEKYRNRRSRFNLRFNIIAGIYNYELNFRLWKKSNVDWLDNDTFKELTTSDGSNNSGKLKRRIEYVRNILLNNSNI